MNYNTIVVFDFETDGVNPNTCQPTQLAAVAINPRTLEIDRENVFNTLIKPADMSLVSDEVLKLTHIDRDELAKAPELSEVWHSFKLYLKTYTKSRMKFGKPVPAGYNITGYDMIILDRLAVQFKDADDNGRQNIFSPFLRYDLMDDIFRLTENTDKLKKYSDSGRADMKLTTVRRWLGKSAEQAHDAKNDVLDTAEIIVRFLKWYRQLMQRTKFEGVFST